MQNVGCGGSDGGGDGRSDGGGGIADSGCFRN